MPGIIHMNLGMHTNIIKTNLCKFSSHVFYNKKIVQMHSDCPCEVSFFAWRKFILEKSETEIFQAIVGTIINYVYSVKRWSFIFFAITNCVSRGFKNNIAGEIAKHISGLILRTWRGKAIFPWQRALLWGICKFLLGLLKGHQGKDQGQQRQLPPLPPLNIRPDILLKFSLKLKIQNMLHIHTNITLATDSFQNVLAKHFKLSSNDSCSNYC